MFQFPILKPVVHMTWTDCPKIPPLLWLDIFMYTDCWMYQRPKQCTTCEFLPDDWCIATEQCQRPTAKSWRTGKFDFSNLIFATFVTCVVFPFSVCRPSKGTASNLFDNSYIVCDCIGGDCCTGPYWRYSAIATGGYDVTERLVSIIIHTQKLIIYLLRTFFIF